MHRSPNRTRGWLESPDAFTNLALPDAVRVRLDIEGAGSLPTPHAQIASDGGFGNEN